VPGTLDSGSMFPFATMVSWHQNCTQAAQGARGELHVRWLENLPEITAAATTTGLAWPDY